MVGRLSIPAVPMPTLDDTQELIEELKDSSMLRELGGRQMKPPPHHLPLKEGPQRDNNSTQFLSSPGEMYTCYVPRLEIHTLSFRELYMSEYLT